LAIHVIEAHTTQTTSEGKHFHRSLDVQCFTMKFKVSKRWACALQNVMLAMSTNIEN